MPNNSTKAATLLLALAVADAARLHEESYDKKAATADAMDAERRIGCWGQDVDFSRYYRKSLEDAADESATLHGLDGSGPLIYLVLRGRWNEALEWADEVSRMPVEVPPAVPGV